MGRCKDCNYFDPNTGRGYCDWYKCAADADDKSCNHYDTDSHASGYYSSYTSSSARCNSCKHLDDNTKNGYKRYCTWYKSYVDPDDRTCSHYDSGSSGSGGCYLTSACKWGKGLLDDCPELNILRTYRDTYLKVRPEGPEIIKHYYTIAPKIVNSINEKVNSETIWVSIYNELILKCVALIKLGKNDETYELYQKYSLYLEKTYT